MDGLTRLDAESKVALMAALIYDPSEGMFTAADKAVDIAMEIEQKVHERVSKSFAERRDKKEPRADREIDYSRLR